MTEEEIEKQAINYAIENYGAEDIVQSIFLQAISKESFQEGAKWMQEHAIQWHEINRCSKDLPPRSEDNYLHSVIVSNEYGEPIYYDYNCEEWCDMEDDIVSESYKYWCELPTYKE